MRMTDHARQLIDAKYKRRWLADKCAINPVYLGQVIRGEVTPGRLLAKTIAQTLELEFSEVWDLEPGEAAS